MTVINTEYEIAEDVKRIAERVLTEDISSEHPRFPNVVLDKIVFLKKNTNSKSYIAKIAGINGIWKYITDNKYILIVNQKIFDQLPVDKQMRVIEHELLHVSVNFDGKLYKHDVEDFSYMLQKYGIDYLSDIKYKKPDGNIEEIK